jgi:hypothetical protein
MYMHMYEAKLCPMIALDDRARMCVIAERALGGAARRCTERTRKVEARLLDDALHLDEVISVGPR